MKTMPVALLVLSACLAGLPPPAEARPLGSQVIRPDRRPLVTQPRPAPAPKVSDKVAEGLSDCSSFGDAVVPSAAFDAKASELTAAGVQRGRLRFDRPGPAHDSFFLQAFENLTLVGGRGCPPTVFAVLNPINTAWWAKPRNAIDWGWPTADTQRLPSGGMMQTFSARTRGSAAPVPAVIAWSEKTGAHAVEGQGLVERYLADGGPDGVGFPLGNTLPSGDGGYFNVFERLQDGDRGTLYARPGMPVHRVQGQVHKFWEDAGREESFLGWPRSSERSAAPGQVRQAFEGGYVLWDAMQGARVETPPYQVVFRGFTTLSQSSDQFPDPDSAEYTFFVGVAPRTGGDVRHTRLPTHEVEYARMIVQRWRSAEVVVYSGTADSLLLTFNGLERDSGSPDELLPTVKAATNKILETAGNALGGLVGGPAGAAAGGELAGIPAEPLGKAIHEGFDLGPELLRPTYYVLNIASLRNFIENPAPMQTTIPGLTAAYHFRVDMRNKEGDHVRLFFEVVPGHEREWFGR